ncbi:MAG: hypothetical protein ACR2G7_08040 [Acidimicrobiales bacterium]
MAPLDVRDVQGLVVSGYGDMHEARYLLLHVTDRGAACRWVGELAHRVTASTAPEDRRCINIALTADGLGALGARCSRAAPLRHDLPRGS